MDKLVFASLVILTVTEAVLSQQTGRKAVSCSDVFCPDGDFCFDGACYCPTCLPPTTPITTTTTNLAPLSSNACYPNPCKRNCVCRESCQHEDGYYCASSDGYLGKNCDITAPILTCGNSEITLSVSEEILDDLFPWRSLNQVACFYIAPNERREWFDQNVETCRFCVSTGSFYTVILPLPFQRCGTTLQSDDGSGLLAYKNAVWANLQDGSDYDMPKKLLEFQCSYNRQYDVMTSIQPWVEVNRASVVKSMKLRASIELCKIAGSCPGPCPPVYAVQSGAVYTVSETIHATMTVQSTYWDQDDFAYLHNMYISCSIVNPGRRLTLVSQGCEADRLSMRINKVESSKDTVCVSFKVPRVTKCLNRQFYIHAELRLASRAYLPDCSNSVPARRRRLVDATDVEKKSAVLYMGPIYSLPVVEGSGSYSIYPEEKTDGLAAAKQLFERTEDRFGLSDIPAGNDVLTAVVAVIGGIAVLLLILVFVFLCKSYK